MYLFVRINFYNRYGNDKQYAKDRKLTGCHFLWIVRLLDYSIIELLKWKLLGPPLFQGATQRELWASQSKGRAEGSILKIGSFSFVKR